MEPILFYAQAIIESLLLLYFIYVSLYNLILSSAGLFYSPPKKEKAEKLNRIGVFIPAYKEDGVIVEVAQKALEQSYPTELYRVIVIADSLQESTLHKLNALAIDLCVVSFEKSTKVKALNKAFETYNDFDLGVILDADNVMEKDFLHKMNASFESGHTVIQGKRIAKNKNTHFAVLDGLSETINNHIFRKGTTQVGWASSLIGSGMAFEFGLLRKTLGTMVSIGGFDRELEVRLLLQGHKAYYVSNAEVEDEKVDNPEVFENQRKRWISSQFTYLKTFFKPGMKAFFRGRFSVFNSTILRNIQLPRVLNLGLFTILTAATLLLSSYLILPTLYWITAYALFVLSFIFAVPLSFYKKDFFLALTQVPKAFLIMFSLLFKLKGANKTFIHTPHSSNSNKS